MIYIHVPYCRTFCNYCDFYSEIPEGGFETFVNALCSEITARRGEIPWEHNTLYIGGGTPSVLPLNALRRVVEALGKANFDEFTIEVNPDDVVRLGVEYVRGLVELGVNRISMGVQSLDDRVLKWMNRRHSSAAAREAYRIIRDGGIENISVDLIFGLGDICAMRSDGENSGATGLSGDSSPRAGESFDSTETLLNTLDDFLNIGGDGIPPTHISAYQLSIEPGSELAHMVERGEYVPASDEVCARQYEIICGHLAVAGYRHYEISNFAQPGFEAKHNSAYWRHIPYIGFGPAAHSFFVSEGKHIRRWNKPDLCAYLKAASTGDWNSVSEGEDLTADQIREERIMLALRTDIGIPAFEIPNAEKMVKKGLLEIVNHPVSSSANLNLNLTTPAVATTEPHLRIPESKFFVSDAIISDLF